MTMLLLAVFPANARQPHGLGDRLLGAQVPPLEAVRREVLALAATERAACVPPESPDMLAESLRRLADDTPLRARLGTAAREYAEAHLAREPVLERFLERLQGED